jgi:hypothetical protein
VVDALKKSNQEGPAGKLRWTPKEVLIHQADNQTMHIDLDVPHSEHFSPSWYGESVGRYEGDELVVDTVGFNDRTFLDDHYDLPHRTQLHVIERFRQ